MPIQHFQIYLHKQNEPYTAGERLNGKFVILLTEPYTHNGIYLKFEGHAIIKWTEDSSCFDHTADKQHRARKQFFDASFKYASEATLGEGTHIFPFEYELPPHLPSSLSTPTITIWYKMETLIHKDLTKPRREVIVFPVKGQLDLNSAGQGLPVPLNTPLSQVKSRSMLAFYPPFFCSLHYASVGLRVGQQGFLPGEMVIINLALLTDMHFTFVSLSLIQEITVVTKEKTMIERRTTVKLTLADLTPEDSDDYRRWNENLMIPPDSVVSSNASEYPGVKINYFIKFSAEATKFPYKVIKILLPVWVGSVPLVEVINKEDGLSIVQDDDHDPFIPKTVVESCKSEIEQVQPTQQQTPPTSQSYNNHHSTRTLLLADQDEPFVDVDDNSGTGPNPSTPLPPTIVVDVECPQLQPLPEESEGFPSMDSTFLNSFENSLIQVVPVASCSKTSYHHQPSPQKGVLRRVSIADSSETSPSTNSSPVKRLAFQEPSTIKQSSPKIREVKTPSPPSYAFSTSL